MVSSTIADKKAAGLAIGSISVLGVLYLYRKICLKATLPPGPPPSSIVGNVLQMPKEQPWLKYAEWAKQYGKSYLAESRKLIKNTD